MQVPLRWRVGDVDLHRESGREEAYERRERIHRKFFKGLQTVAAAEPPKEVAVMVGHQGPRRPGGKDDPGKSREALSPSWLQSFPSAILEMD